MGWIACVRCEKFRHDCGTNYCTSSAHFAPSFLRQPNGLDAPKWYKMHQNVSLGSNGVEWVCSLRKIMKRLCGMNFCTSSARFAPSFVRQPNGPECTQVVRNAPRHQFGSNRVDRVRSLRKILTQLHGSNICTSSARFAPSFVRQPNGPEYTQMVRNALKCHFRVQWRGSVAFVVKNPDANSWHEHLH